MVQLQAVAASGTASNRQRTAPQWQDPSIIQDVPAHDPGDTGFRHVGPGPGQRSVRIDGPRRVLDHRHVEAAGGAVDRRPADAEIGGEADDEQPADIAFPQISGEPRQRLAIRFLEARIAVDGPVVTLAQHELGMGNVEVPADLGAMLFQTQWSGQSTCVP